MLKNGNSVVISMQEGYLRPDVAMKRGMVMYPEREMPLQEAALSDPFVKDAMGKVAKGDLAAQAPTGKDKIVWTDSDVQRLDEALAKVFGQP